MAWFVKCHPPDLAFPMRPFLRRSRPVTDSDYVYRTMGADRKE
jgi:hypothetical protein